MSVTAKAYIQHERLALVPTLERLDDIQISVIAQGTTDPDVSVFPFLIEYDCRSELEQMLERDSTVDSYEAIDWSDQRGIYSIEHTPETKYISKVVTDQNGFLVHTNTQGGGWFVHLLLPDRQALSTIWEYATENEITFEIIEVYGNDVDIDEAYGLTDEQRAALNIAYEMGYFGEPREISLCEVADELGVSSTAMSGRLRRGMRNLIASTIGENDVEE